MRFLFVFAEAKMTNTKGYRRGTRYMFSRQFRKRGVIPLSTYLKVYKRGDIVDIKVWRLSGRCPSLSRTPPSLKKKSSKGQPTVNEMKCCSWGDRVMQRDFDTDKNLQSLTELHFPSKGFAAENGVAKM